MVSDIDILFPKDYFPIIQAFRAMKKYEHRVRDHKLY